MWLGAILCLGVLGGIMGALVNRSARPGVTLSERGGLGVLRGSRQGDPLELAPARPIPQLVLSPRSAALGRLRQRHEADPTPDFARVA